MEKHLFYNHFANGVFEGSLILHSYVNASDAIGFSLDNVEENNYYPFGLKHKGYNNQMVCRDHKYGFGGKEEQNELGLEWHDFHSRNYDASLGRWMNVDPLAEQMRRHSPYNYAFDNPIFFTDPDGMAPQGTCRGGWNPVAGIGESIKRNVQSWFAPNDFSKGVDNLINTTEAVIMLPVRLLNNATGGYILEGDGSSSSISDSKDRKAGDNTERLPAQFMVDLAKAYGPQIDSKPFEFANIITGFAELTTETVGNDSSTSENTSGNKSSSDNDMITMELDRYTTTGGDVVNASKVHKQTTPKDTTVVRQDKAKVEALNNKRLKEAELKAKQENNQLGHE